MDMVNLMLGVEAEFDFTIPQAEITPENFQSVETQQRMIANELSAGAGRLNMGVIPGRCASIEPGISTLQVRTVPK
jgi:hypothetical protein